MFISHEHFFVTEMIRASRVSTSKAWTYEWNLVYYSSRIPNYWMRDRNESSLQFLILSDMSKHDHFGVNTSDSSAFPRLLNSHTSLLFICQGPCRHKRRVICVSTNTHWQVKFCSQIKRFSSLMCLPNLN